MRIYDVKKCLQVGVEYSGYEARTFYVVPFYHQELVSTMGISFSTFTILFLYISALMAFSCTITTIRR